MKTKKKFSLLPIFIFMVWLSAAVLPASAATITVTSGESNGGIYLKNEEADTPI